MFIAQKQSHWDVFVVDRDTKIFETTERSKLVSTIKGCSVIMIDNTVVHFLTEGGFFRSGLVWWKKKK